jgi:hypothetical protein
MGRWDRPLLPKILPPSVIESSCASSANDRQIGSLAFMDFLLHPIDEPIFEVAARIQRSSFTHVFADASSCHKLGCQYGRSARKQRSPNRLRGPCRSFSVAWRMRVYWPTGSPLDIAEELFEAAVITVNHPVPHKADADLHVREPRVVLHKRLLEFGRNPAAALLATCQLAPDPYSVSHNRPSGRGARGRQGKGTRQSVLRHRFNSCALNS